MLRHLRLAVAIMACVPAIALALSVRPSAARAFDLNRYQIDYAGEELMRLTNMDRQALGLEALRSDPTLIDVARDAGFACPSTGAVVHGRARDMARNGFFSHGIAGCTRSDGTNYTVLDVLYPELGYDTFRAENIAMNSYGSATVTYTAGCDLHGGSCRGGVTDVLETVAVAETGFMRSPAHRADLLGKYDRFGCGSWVDDRGSMKYYACLFSDGGPGKLDTTPPQIRSVTGDGATVDAGQVITFDASLSDNVRLALGDLALDSNVITTWSYGYDQASDSRSIPVRTAGLARGRHELTWTVRDVSSLLSRRSVVFFVR